jgi:protein-tyrosine phosphatase
MRTMKILFICMGNICRSPAAEGIFKSLVEAEKLTETIYIESAGTTGYHSGECADSRMVRHALKRGYDLNSHKARMFNPQKDFENFNYIITMDNDNYSGILELDKTGRYAHKVKKVTQFSKIYNEEEVPDPYFGGSKGFEYVLDLLEDSCSELLERIKDELKNL